MRTLLVGLAAGLLLSFSAHNAAAASITLTVGGTLFSDATAISPSDPVITDASAVNTGDPFSFLLTFTPGAFSQPFGGAYVFGDAAATVGLGGVSFDYDAAAGSFIGLFSPGAFGDGTTSLQVCSDAFCQNDFLNLYFTGSVSGPDSLVAEASSLAGDTAASPMAFELLRNFDDGSQTDLMGTIDSVSAATTTETNPVPEPSTIWLLASGAAQIGLFVRRRRAASPRS